MTFNNCTVSVAAAFAPPYIRLTEPLPPTFLEGDVVNLTQGVEVEIMNAMSKQYNFVPMYR